MRKERFERENPKIRLQRNKTPLVMRYVLLLGKNLNIEIHSYSEAKRKRHIVRGTMYPRFVKYTKYDYPQS